MAPSGWGVWVRRTAAVAALCSSCGGASKGAMCPLPSPGTPEATLTVRETHEFGADYDVLSVTYYVDDCILLQSEDTALLRKPAVDFEPRKVPAGSRRFRYAIKYKSGFSADMHDYWWGLSGEAPLEVPEGTTVTLTLRMFEHKEADPRDRVRILLQTTTTR